MYTCFLDGLEMEIVDTGYNKLKPKDPMRFRWFFVPGTPHHNEWCVWSGTTTTLQYAKKAVIANALQWVERWHKILQAENKPKRHGNKNENT